MGRPHDHVGDAKLVLYLTHHDAQIPRVVRHPVEHSGGWAHGIGGIELDPCRGAAHGERVVACPDREGLRPFGRRNVAGREVCQGVLVARAGHANVFVNDILASSLKLLRYAVLQDGNVHTQQMRNNAQRDGVLIELVAAVVGELGNGHRTEMNTVLRHPGLN